jgi:ribosomal protein S18 acetylase RimI-like enzyme
VPKQEVPSEVILKYGISDIDVQKAAGLFDQAFSGKFQYAIRNDSLRIKFWSEIINCDQIVVAYINGELVGIALISFDGRPGFLKSAKNSLFEILGCCQGIKSGFYFVLFSKLDKKVVFPNAYLEAISVSQKYRGLGIGNLLISEVSKVAKEQGNTSLLLQVVLENHQAQKLYERIGFKVVSVTKTPFLKIFTRVSGASLMAKEL